MIEEPDRRRVGWRLRRVQNELSSTEEWSGGLLMNRVRTLLLLSVLVVGVLVSPAPVMAQGKSGPQSIDACGVVTKEEIEAGLKRKIQSRPVPPATPASIGVSHCMWATPDGRRTMSVTTYGPEALKRTHTRTPQQYYDSLKTSNANNTGRPAQVLPGIGRHASFFANAQGGSTVLVLRPDSVVVMSFTGVAKEEAAAVARAAGN